MGGGIAGLAAAYELHTRGVAFRLFERAARPGGVIFTDRVGGFTIDAGPDALLIQKPAAVALCREIGLGGRLLPTKRPRTAYIIRDGRLHPLPESSVLGIPRDVRALATTRLFSLAGKARMAAELFVPAARANGDESIASFIGRRFGSEAVTYLAEPLLAGIHAGDVNRLSMRGLFPRFTSCCAHSSAARVIRARWPVPTRTCASRPSANSAGSWESAVPPCSLASIDGSAPTRSTKSATWIGWRPSSSAWRPGPGST